MPNRSVNQIKPSYAKMVNQKRRINRKELMYTIANNMLLIVELKELCMIRLKDITIRGKSK